MKTKNLLSRIAILLLTLTVTFIISGWIPFTVPVTIHSMPEGAKVYVDGRVDPVGVTPFTTRVFHRTTRYKLTLDKFLPEKVTVNFESPKNIYVTMRTRPVLVYTKPAAGIYPVGSDTALGRGSVEVDVLPEDRDYIVKADGYYDQQITIGMSTENPVVVELKPLPTGIPAADAE